MSRFHFLFDQPRFEWAGFSGNPSDLSCLNIASPHLAIVCCFGARTATVLLDSTCPCRLGRSHDRTDMMFLASSVLPEEAIAVL